MSLTPQPLPLDHARGDLNAPLIVVHYGDFECPYSGALAPLLNQLQTELGEKMCLIFRAFPLSDIHPHAFHAALAAEAAGESFWEMHDLLFANQKMLEDEDLIGYAAQVGIGRAEFTDAMKAPETRASVEESVESGHRSGAHGTPTVFINGEFYDNDRQLWKPNKLLPLIQATLGEN